MLVRLRKGLDPRLVEPVLVLCEQLGYRWRFVDEERRTLHLEGPGRPEHRTKLEDLPAIEAVLDAGDARELHELRSGQRPRCVAVGRARFGGGRVSIVAGPCAVEDEELLLQIAREVQTRGATLLRGGAFKPRTSPYSFQGLGQRGLEILARVRAEVGIGVVTEVIDPREVAAVAEVADAIQIGARSMHQAPLLLEVGRAGKPVVLKRGFGSTVRELLMAAEYVLSTGNERVILCERGVRSFDHTTRNLLDVGAVAHLKRATHLPVIVDPSHAAGRADLVRPLARAGLAAGADGLLIEVHPRPGEAYSDGGQAISTPELGRICADARALCVLDERTLVTADEPASEDLQTPTGVPA